MRSYAWWFTLLVVGLGEVSFGNAGLVETQETGLGLVARPGGFGHSCFALVYDLMASDAYIQELDFNFVAMEKLNVSVATEKPGQNVPDILEKALLPYESLRKIETGKPLSSYKSAGSLGIDKRGHRSVIILELCTGNTSYSVFGIIEAKAKAMIEGEHAESSFRLVEVPRISVPFGVKMSPQMHVVDDRGYRTMGLQRRDMGGWKFEYTLYFFDEGEAKSPVSLGQYEDPNVRFLVPGIQISQFANEYGHSTSWTGVEFGYYRTHNEWVAMDVDGSPHQFTGAQNAFESVEVSTNSPVIIYSLADPSLSGQVLYKAKPGEPIYNFLGGACQAQQ